MISLAEWTEGELLIALSSTDLVDHELVEIEYEWLKRLDDRRRDIEDIMPL